MKAISKSLIAFVCVALFVVLGVWFFPKPKQSVPIETPSAQNYLQALPTEVPKPKQGIHPAHSITVEVRKKETLITEANTSHDPEPTHLDPQAISSMRAARINGDPRSPTLSRAKPRVLPSDEELADADLYLNYQARQRQKVFVNFIQATGPKIDQLNELIQRGIQEGISQEELEQGQEKVRRLENMVKQLKEENPEIIDQLDES